MTEPDAESPTVGDLLDARTAARGDHPLLVCDDRTLTYAEAAGRSAALARGFLASGLARGSRVGILHPNGPEFAVAALAAARIGAIAVPVSTFSTPVEMRSLLNNADVDTLVAARGYRGHDYIRTIAAAVAGFDPRAHPPLFSPSVPALRRVAFNSAGSEVGAGWTAESMVDAGTAVSPDVLRACQDRVGPSDRLVIVHTSGSSSEPKGVILTHGSLVGHLRTLNELRRYDRDEILFSNSPFFWIGGYAYALLATLEAGGTLVCSNSQSPSAQLDLLERCRPTMVNGFAQSVAHLPGDPTFTRRDLTSIRRGNLYPIMPEAIRPTDVELHHNMLGMTETGSVCLASDDETRQPEHRRGSFGRPVPDVEAKIVEAGRGSPVDTGVVGELCLRGPALMEGYCGREYHETFDNDGWYHSGDCFHVDDEGFHYFHGRLGDMIKTSGANVSPREIEAVILEETGLVAHVVGVDDMASGQLVVAVIRVPSASAAPDPGKLQSVLRTRLSVYKVPKRILFVDEERVPMMSSGKPDVRALKELARAH